MKLTLRPKPAHTWNALGMHIYAGGFALGVRKHFNILAHLEEWPFGVETVRHNLKIEVRQGMPTWQAEQFRHITDFMFCNPPCAAWSQAGNKKGQDKRWKQDERVDCTRRCFDVMSVVQPTIFAWECVTQAWSQGRQFVLEKTKECWAQGYDVSILLVNANGCGLPQKRKRMFFVAHKVAFNPKPHDSWGGTVREALKGVSHDSDQYRREVFVNTLLKADPKLKNKKIYMRKLFDAVAPKGTKGRPPFIQYRCAWDEPCGVVMADNTFHPEEPRNISMNEMKRLCGYPDSYKFVEEKKNDSFYQMTRAVMPPVGEYLARQVKTALDESKSTKERTLTVYDYRKQDHPKVERLDPSICDEHSEGVGEQPKQGPKNESGSRDLRPTKRRLVLRVQRVSEGDARPPKRLVIRRKV